MSIVLIGNPALAGNTYVKLMRCPGQLLVAQYKAGTKMVESMMVEESKAEAKRIRVEVEIIWGEL